MNLKNKLVNPVLRLPNRILRKFNYRLVEARGIPLSYYIKEYGRKAVAERRFLNLGAGAFFNHPAWSNLNLRTDWYCSGRIHVEHDLISGKPLPLKDSSFFAVYSSNTIEHVDQKNDELLFREVRRILRKGGVFRIQVPDTDLFFQAYQDKDRLFYDINNASFDKVSLPQLFLHSIASQISATFRGNEKNRISDEALGSLFRKMKAEDAFNNITSRCSLDIQRRHPAHHINWFNADKLYRMLREAGFSSVRVSGFGQSRVHILRDTNFFDCSNPRCGVFIEAFK